MLDKLVVAVAVIMVSDQSIPCPLFVQRGRSVGSFLSGLYRAVKTNTPVGCQIFRQSDTEGNGK